MKDVDDDLLPTDPGSAASEDASTHVLNVPEPKGKSSPRPRLLHHTPADRAARGKAAQPLPQPAD